MTILAVRLEGGIPPILFQAGVVLGAAGVVLLAAAPPAPGGGGSCEATSRPEWGAGGRIHTVGLQAAVYAGGCCVDRDLSKLREDMP